MPIDTVHPSYPLALDTWKKIRTVLKGQTEVKRVAHLYVPKPRGFENKEILWKEYIQRGEFYNASHRTVTGLLGAMFRRAPVIELPGGYDSWKKSITQEGVSIEGFCKLVSKELIEAGRFGIFVDMPENPGVSGKIRPYLCGYSAEQIINWEFSPYEDPENPGVIVLLPTLIVLEECIWEKDPKDRYKKNEVKQYRSLELDEEENYIVNVWRKGEKETEYKIVQSTQPIGPNGKPLSFIPFIFVSPENFTPDIERSPIEDLVDVNISHFITALDLEWSCHLTACPQAVVTGWSDKNVDLAMGSAVAWTFEDDKVRAELLEYKGEGLNALETRARAKEDKMAKLGANLLRAKSKQPETAETTRIEHSAEASILSMIARNSSAAVTRALLWALWWASGTQQKASVEQNTEFYDARLTYQELDTLMKGVQEGSMPVSVYCFNLIRGDMVKAGTDQKQLEAEVEKSLEAKKPPLPINGLNPGVPRPPGAKPEPKPSPEPGPTPDNRI